MRHGAKMALGWVCFHAWKLMPGDTHVTSRMGLWLLSWAGYYADPPR